MMPTIDFRKLVLTRPTRNDSTNEVKKRDVAEVVLALKLSVDEVQEKLGKSNLKDLEHNFFFPEFASANVKEMKESIRSQDIAHVAKEVTMIFEIKAQEQEDKDDAHNIQ
ncbi:hypothetical protein CAEBREN_09060 [Caenorhabditis brenneri]|uniref:Uncharacterized protein n=1 Tax=Caenorhabditis brenneri TaxID=135651 RepID=G0PCT1_CAEBE|nr:hypothetical protein CAEBREN_09060 [Caenorhabditis brenneri]